MSFIGDKDFLLEVAKGNITGHTITNKFGRNPDIDAASSFEAIWNGGGDYRGFDATTGALLDIWSSSTADDAGAGGARTMEIQGLSSAWVEQTETITLNGTAIVNSTNKYLRMHRAKVLSAGSSNTNQGNIVATQTGATAIQFMSMPVGYNQTMIAAFTIPADKKGYIVNWYASNSNRKDTDNDIRLVARPPSETFQVKEEFSLHHDGTSYIHRDYAAPKGAFTSKTDIKVMAQSTVNDTAISAGFDIVVVSCAT